MAQIMIESGKTLNEVRPVQVENLIMKVRQIICAKDISLHEETNVFLLNVSLILKLRVEKLYCNPLFLYCCFR